MSRFRGWGKRGGPDELFAITFIDYSGDNTSWWRTIRGSFFDGLHYPARWDFKYEVVWRKRWRGWQLGWGFETIGYNDEHYGMEFHLLPLTVYLHLTTNGILPKPAKEREWSLVGGFSEGVAHSPHVHYTLGPGGINKPWTDKQGRKVVGIFDLWDFLFGRNVYSRTTGEPYELDVPLPERTYRVKATPEVATWRRPRWPWWPLVMTRRSVEIDSTMDPLPEPGNDESDYWDGDDAIFGMGVDDGGTRREIGQRVADHVMETRKRHGGGYDWRPTRDFRKPSKSDGDVAVKEG